MEHRDCLILGVWGRWDWQDDFRGGPPVLSDLDPVDDHQKWLGRSVLSRIGDRDIHRRIGFRKVLSQADNLELRKVRLKHDRPSCLQTGPRSSRPEGPKAIARTSHAGL
jgi:hypothetical protein